MNRTTLAYQPSPPYSASQVPARTPTTRPMAMPRPQSISEPTMALASPPWEPGAGVDMVKTEAFSPPTPLLSSE